jgi:hypothetical protein
MISLFVNNFYRKLIQSAESLTSGRFWLPVIILISLTCALFFAFPSYDAITSENNTLSWQAVLEKSADPFMDMSQKYEPESHESKLTFRITVPILAHLLNLGIFGMIGLQFIVGVFILGLSAQVVHNLTQDRLLALFAAILVAGTYAGTTSFVELRGIFDGVAIFFLILALSMKNSVLISIAIFLAAWTDERGLVASLFVFLFHAMSNEIKDRKTWRNYLSPAPLAVIIGGIAYLVSRYLMATIFKLATPIGGIGLDLLFNQFNQFPMGTWTALEGGWLLVLIATIILLQKRMYATLMLMVIGIFGIISISLSVIDITRSMAYMIPVLFVAIKAITGNEPQERIRQYLVSAGLISLLSANYYAGGEKSIWWQYPLPLQLLRWIFLNQ